MNNSGGGGGATSIECNAVSYSTHIVPLSKFQTSAGTPINVQGGSIIVVIGNETSFVNLRLIETTVPDSFSFKHGYRYYVFSARPEIQIIKLMENLTSPFMDIRLYITRDEDDYTYSTINFEKNRFNFNFL